MKQKLILDERTQRLNGQISFYVLMLTHLVFGGTIFYLRYIRNLDGEYYQTFSFVLLGSILAYWAARLYTAGILPVLSWKALLGIYIAAVLVISIPSALIHGLPTSQNWTNTLLPAMLGPALVILAYWLIAYFGKRRLDKEINE